MLILYDGSIVILSLVFHSSFKQCCPLASSYLLGGVSSIGLQNSLFLTMISFRISFLCFSALDKISIVSSFWTYQTIFSKVIIIHHISSLLCFSYFKPFTYTRCTLPQVSKVRGKVLALNISYLTWFLIFFLLLWKSSITWLKQKRLQIYLSSIKTKVKTTKFPFFFLFFSVENRLVAERDNRTLMQWLICGYHIWLFPCTVVWFIMFFNPQKISWTYMSQ